MLVQLAKLLAVFHIYAVVVLERFRYALRNPNTILNDRLVRFRKLVERPLELSHAETFVVEREAGEYGGDVWMAPLRGW